MMEEEITQENIKVYYSRIMDGFKTIYRKYNELNPKLNNLYAENAESLRATHLGIQHIYDKFNELEKRQTQIEKLLESDHIKSLVDLIPKENDILKIFKMVDNHPLAHLKDDLRIIRDDLQELIERFTL